MIPSISSERDLFDEVIYLWMYLDVATAISGGRIGSAWEHYEKHGRSEGRSKPRFDAEYYQRAYPLALEEIHAGRAATPLEHYMRFGKARGYLPHSRAERPANANELPSRFGGLWPDLPAAADIVRGKREIGQITERQAALLSSWIADGYIVLEQAIPARLIDFAVADLDKAFSGGFGELLFECHAVSKSLCPGKQRSILIRQKLWTFISFPRQLATSSSPRPSLSFLD